MKTIKFRGKRADNGEWVYGFYMALSGTHNILSANSDSPSGATYYEVIPSTVSRYTGLKDENSKEIYEDDVISGCFKYETLTAEGGVIPDQDCLCKGVVKFSEIRLQWVLEIFWAESPISKWMEEEEDSEIPLVHFEYESPEFNMDLLEVIGNVYENPELM